MEKAAQEILKQANEQGISINKLCERAGVSRRWFEYLKNRTPASIKSWLKVNDALEQIKKEKNGNSDHTGKTQGD